MGQASAMFETLLTTASLCSLVDVFEEQRRAVVRSADMCRGQADDSFCRPKQF